MVSAKIFAATAALLVSQAHGNVDVGADVDVSLLGINLDVAANVDIGLPAINANVNLDLSLGGLDVTTCSAYDPFVKLAFISSAKAAAQLKGRALFEASLGADIDVGFFASAAASATVSKRTNGDSLDASVYAEAAGELVGLWAFNIYDLLALNSCNLDACLAFDVSLRAPFLADLSAKVLADASVTLGTTGLLGPLFATVDAGVDVLGLISAGLSADIEVLGGLAFDVALNLGCSSGSIISLDADARATFVAAVVASAEAQAKGVHAGALASIASWATVDVGLNLDLGLEADFATHCGQAASIVAGASFDALVALSAKAHVDIAASLGISLPVLSPSAGIEASVSLGAIAGAGFLGDVAVGVAVAAGVDVHTGLLIGYPVQSAISAAVGGTFLASVGLAVEGVLSIPETLIGALVGAVVGEKPGSTVIGLESYIAGQNITDIGLGLQASIDLGTLPLASANVSAAVVLGSAIGVQASLNLGSIFGSSFSSQPFLNQSVGAYPTTGSGIGASITIPTFPGLPTLPNSCPSIRPGKAPVAVGVNITIPGLPTFPCMPMPPMPYVPVLLPCPHPGKSSHSSTAPVSSTATSGVATGTTPVSITATATSVPALNGTASLPGSGSSTSVSISRPSSSAPALNVTSSLASVSHVRRPSSSGPARSQVESTITSEIIHTITSCAPEVTNCPARSIGVSTETVTSVSTGVGSISTVSTASTPQGTNVVESTITSVILHTITSCAPEVTNCPAKSISISSETVTSVFKTTGSISTATAASVPQGTNVVESTITSEIMHTITSCAPEVTNCPANSKSISVETITSVVAVTYPASSVNTPATSSPAAGLPAVSSPAGSSPAVSSLPAGKGATSIVVASPPASSLSPEQGATSVAVAGTPAASSPAAASPAPEQSFTSIVVSSTLSKVPTHAPSSYPSSNSTTSVSSGPGGVATASGGLTSPPTTAPLAASGATKMGFSGVFAVVFGAAVLAF
ncbi:hypothetical protein B7494_g5296 [Chlorociboria aeruginascens]|nr:hypothetical protein B7494_g5296 [Chlorociboria aeruginascens]